MNLHEYQAKELLARYGLRVQSGVLATNGNEAAVAFDQLGGKFAVVKAQVHAGGRGKAGGVKVVKSRDEARDVTESLIGKNLVTYQTDAASKFFARALSRLETEVFRGVLTLLKQNGP